MQVLQTIPLGLSPSSAYPKKHHHQNQVQCPSKQLFILLRRSNASLISSGAHGSSLSPKFRNLAVAFAAGDDSPSTSAPSLSQEDADPQDLEYIQQIKRVLELLRKNRDMIFSEVKLTVMIEDPRDAERRRMLGIEDTENAPSRDDLAATLEEVNEGKIPENRLALQMLAEELNQWPNLEVEPEKKKPSKSKYARATDTGVDPKVAAKRLNIDWDTAAEIDDDQGGKDENEVPSLLGYGALYFVTGFPVIIGVSVVLILFYNSLQ